MRANDNQAEPCSGQCGREIPLRVVDYTLPDGWKVVGFQAVYGKEEMGGGPVYLLLCPDCGAEQAPAVRRYNEAIPSMDPMSHPFYDFDGKPAPYRLLVPEMTKIR